MRVPNQCMSEIRPPTSFNSTSTARCSNSLHLCEQAGLGEPAGDIALATALVAHLEKVWTRPDQGIWESRGPAQHFTHSKVMAWVGIDRFLKL